jgi:hypothetical protein
MSDDQIRLDLPALAAGRAFSHVTDEAALVFGCVLDEIEAVSEVMRDMFALAGSVADSALPAWQSHEAAR